MEAMSDTNGRTFFNIFATRPAEAVTDWPDFVDLPARYWEAAAFLEETIGFQGECTDRLRRFLFSHIAEDGLAYRPDTPISRRDAELFDQSRLLYALATWAMHDPGDEEVRKRLSALCDGLRNKATFHKDYACLNKIGVYYGGTLIRPLVQAGLLLNDERHVEFANLLSNGILWHSDQFGAAGEFVGHVHGHLGTLAGFVSVGLLTGNDAMLARARDIFSYARSISTEHGFVPELAQRKDDLIACETCAIMDYLDAALLLARSGEDELWSAVEKTVRNHLVQSQIPDAPWLDFSDEAGDEEWCLRRGLQGRLAGAFAGWSAPHALLAYEESLWPEWVRTESLQPRYLGKVRAVQNCCAGAGIRALHQAWRNIVTRDGTLVSVNMLISRRTPDLEVTSHIPADGHVRLSVLREAELRFRIPEGSQQLEVAVNGRPAEIRRRGVFAEVGHVCSGDIVQIQFRLVEQDRDFQVGNAGFQHYGFTGRWRGETVTEITPHPENAVSGYSHILKAQTPLFYGDNAPGRRYLHQGSAGPEGAPRLDSGRVDWYCLKCSN